MAGPNRLRFPYELALKAYAFAGKDLDFALEHLRNLHLETPDSSNELHEFEFEQAEALFLYHQRNARKMSPDMEFTKGQAKSLGIDPVYTWLKEEDDPQSPAALFMEMLVKGMRDKNLRKLLSLGLVAGASPEELKKYIRESSIVSIWGMDEITVYTQFFWNTSYMEYNDWLGYLRVTRETLGSMGGGVMPNPHFQYLKLIVGSNTKADMIFEAKLPFALAPPTDRADVCKAALHRTIGCIRSNDRAGAKTYSAIALGFMEAEREADSAVDAELKEDLARLRVVASHAQAKELGVNMSDLGYVAPLPAGSIKGEISDPRLKKSAPKPKPSE